MNVGFGNCWNGFEGDSVANDKVVGLSEETFGEMIENLTNWMDTAQTLAYLIGTPYGAGAEETLRLGRAKLGKLFETLSHDAVCWREIAERSDASEHIRVLAQGRVEALTKLADQAHKRFQDMPAGK
jgi:hypothetical protein